MKSELIENFVLIYFEKTANEIDKHAEKLYKKLDSKRFGYVNKYFKTTTSIIKYLYPKSKIHIISNNKNKSNSEFIWHYKKDLILNNLSKFEIFDIIDESFMYLDLDVLIRKKFTKEQIECEGPFRLYKKYSPYPSKKFNYQHYNTGVMWINNPSKLIKEEVLNLHYKNFNNSFLYLDNDEYAISKFIKEKKIKFKLDESVNFNWADLCNLKNIQSVHYCTAKKRYLIDTLKIL